MRRLSVLVDALPRESATSRVMHGELADWTTEAVLLADVWSALTGERHPALPKPKAKSADATATRAALMAQRARLQGDT